MTKFETVQSEYGAIRGVHKTSALDYDYVSFQGIPYMKQPLGKLRFKEPQEVEKWENVFDATGSALSYVVINPITLQYEGQEDAGILNVFTKNVKPNKLLPVMVWIHGGGFFHGSSSTDIYSPDYILRKDVILVSFNYRLGVIGFLSLDDKNLEVPGNAGLKDQLMALKWIKRNIKNFGGDPENITVFGESAGGASVYYLCITPQAEGLFNRAIIMSGTSFCTQWTLLPRQFCNKYAEKLARRLGWEGESGDERNLLEFLENVEANEIVQKSNVVVSAEDEFANSIQLAFVPVIEPYITENCIIPKHPTKMAKSAWSNKIDLIFTGASFEGIFRAGFREKAAVAYLQNPSFFLPLRELNLKPEHPKAKELGLKIKNLYYNEGEEPSLENHEKFLRFSSESLFWHGIYRAMLARFKYASAKTFLLRFDVDAKLNLFKFVKFCNHFKGASHADDLFYLFPNVFTVIPPKDSIEFKVMEKMVGIYANFAIDGHPNCDEIKPAKFTPQNNGDELKCVQITENDVAEIELPELSKLKVWESVYEQCDGSLYAKL